MPQEEEELKNTSGLCEVTENKQRYHTVVCLRILILIYVCILKCFYPGKHLEIEYYIAIFTSLRKKVCVESYIIWVIQQRQVLFIISLLLLFIKKHSTLRAGSTHVDAGTVKTVQHKLSPIFCTIRFLIWQQDWREVWPLVQRPQIHSHILFFPHHFLRDLEKRWNLHDCRNRNDDVSEDHL